MSRRSVDLIEQATRRTGSFARKTPPTKYLSYDTIGFFKGDGQPHAVDDTFSNELGQAAVSRKWHEAQKVRHGGDGTVTISFVVHDVDEVTRWALRFGSRSVCRRATGSCRAASRNGGSNQAPVGALKPIILLRFQLGNQPRFKMPGGSGLAMRQPSDTHPQ